MLTADTYEIDRVFYIRRKVPACATDPPVVWMRRGSQPALLPCQYLLYALGKSGGAETENRGGVVAAVYFMIMIFFEFGYHVFQ